MTKSKVLLFSAIVLSLCISDYAFSQPREISITGKPVALAPSGNYTEITGDFYMNGAIHFVDGSIQATANPWVMNGSSYSFLSGNIGIGVVSPAEKLEVSGTIRTTGPISLNTDGKVQIYKDSIFFDGGYWTMIDAPSAGNTSQPLRLWAGSGATAPKMIIDGSGNVGIGTEIPASKLHINGGSLYLGKTDSSIHQPVSISIQSTDAGTGRSMNIYTGGDNLETSLIIESAHADGKRNVIVANGMNGKVGIGTGTPSQQLDVNGYVKGQSGLCISSDCRTAWPSFGGWASKSIMVDYFASTDGLVIATSDCAVGDDQIVGYSDGTTHPTTTRINNRGSIASLTMPVMKGDYWRIETNTCDRNIIFWMPFGN
ncbi:MAG: hypothetical protein HZB33_06725 [Nitrospirae bacterium]|nr:hypothetical protein [Nitrospirota bacterium]